MKLEPYAARGYIDFAKRLGVARAREFTRHDIIITILLCAKRHISRDLRGLARRSIPTAVEKIRAHASGVILGGGGATHTFTPV